MLFKWVNISQVKVGSVEPCGGDARGRANDLRQNSQTLAISCWLFQHISRRFLSYADTKTQSFCFINNHIQALEEQCVSVLLCKDKNTPGVGEWGKL